MTAFLISFRTVVDIKELKLMMIVYEILDVEVVTTFFWRNVIKFRRKYSMAIVWSRIRILVEQIFAEYSFSVAKIDENISITPSNIYL